MFVGRKKNRFIVVTLLKPLRMYKVTAGAKSGRLNFAWVSSSLFLLENVCVIDINQKINIVTCGSAIKVSFRQQDYDKTFILWVSRKFRQFDPKLNLNSKFSLIFFLSSQNTRLACSSQISHWNPTRSIFTPARFAPDESVGIFPLYILRGLDKFWTLSSTWL